VNTELEDAVRHALTAGGKSIAVADVDRAGRARVRHRRRMLAGRAATATALFTAVAVVVVGTIATRAGTRHPTPVLSTTQGPTIPILLHDAQPAGSVWPAAVRQLPPLPNGRPYSPTAEVSPGTYVVRSEFGVDDPPLFYRFTPATGRLDLLVDTGKLPRTTVLRQLVIGVESWVVDDRYLVLYVTGDYRDGAPFDLFVYALASDKIIMHIPVAPGHNPPTSVAWLDGALLWSQTDSPAIYSSKNPNRPLRDSRGFQLNGSGTWATKVSGAGGESLIWWNIATGERRTTTVPGGHWADCAGDFCAATVARGEYVAAPNGVWYLATFDPAITTEFPVGRHFRVLVWGDETNDGASYVLWDLATGTYALLGVGGEAGWHYGGHGGFLGLPAIDGLGTSLDLDALP
jgi:hypothetical protein